MELKFECIIVTPTSATGQSDALTPLLENGQFENEASEISSRDSDEYTEGNDDDENAIEEEYNDEMNMKKGSSKK